MSRFPSQFVDMTIERGLFDHTGAQPPATRITIELPPEYIDKPEPGATPPYNDVWIDQQVLNDIQTAVMREYGSVARRYLNAFRQDVSLGSNAVNGRIAMLGDGVGMNYVSQFGNETIRINVSKEGVRKLIGSAHGYMLVIYQKDFGSGENWIGAIPMSKIDNPVGNVYTNRKSESTDPLWSYNGTTQLKVASDLHVVASRIKFSPDGSISTAGGNSFELYYYNTNDSLLKRYTATLPFYTTAPKFNFSGRVLYDNHGNKINFQTTPPTISFETTWLNTADIGASLNLTPAAYVAAVDSNGGLYNYAFKYEKTPNPSTIPIASGTIISNAQNTTLSSVGSQPDVYGLVASCGPGEGDITIQSITMDPVHYDRSGTVGFTQTLMVYSNNGSVDKISIQSVSGSFSDSFDSVSEIRNTATTYMGFSGTGYGTSQYLINSWTGNTYYSFDDYYSFGTSGSDSVISMKTNGNGFFSRRVLQTPVNVIDGAEGYTTTFCANGKTCIRAMDINYYNDICAVHKDRTDYTDALCSALNISKAQDYIVGIFLDIKKSDIDKLK